MTHLTFGSKADAGKPGESSAVGTEVRIEQLRDSRIIGYRILSDRSEPDLAEQVNQLLQSGLGWQPQGGVAVVRWMLREAGLEPRDAWEFCQAMVQIEHLIEITPVVPLYEG